MEQEERQKQRQDTATLLGTAPVGGLLLRLALPAVTAQIVNVLYNIVDRVYIARIEGIGTQALTGVGVCMPLLLLIAAFSSLVGAGGAPRASILAGADKKLEVQKVLGNCISLLVLVAMLLTTALLLFSRPLLLAIGASTETLPYALEYMNIISCGSIFFVLVLGLNPFISAQGFAKTSMATILLGAVSNIILDPILIFAFGLGVKGAAIATVLSQGLSAFWVLRFLAGKRNGWQVSWADMRPRSAVFLPCLALGLSPFTMSLTESLLSICFNMELQRFGGDIAVAAMTIFNSVMQFIKLPITGFTQGAQPIIGFNHGAGNKQRVARAFRALLLACVCCAAIVWLLVMLAPALPVHIFTNEPELLQHASWGIRVYMAAAVLMGIQMACQQTFIALGNAKLSFFLAVLRKLVLLIPLIFILPRVMQNPLLGIYLAEPVADCIAVTTTSLLFYKYFKKVVK